MKHRTAAVLVIGNEILSGRTHEKNARLAAQMLFTHGCKLGEIHIVPDEDVRIVEAIRKLSARYDAVITSGGIGPTHDDITMQSVANALNVKLVEYREVIRMMQNAYGRNQLNPGRRRMARLPEGAEPIHCKNSIAPGVHIGNLYILAGVPEIFASQLEIILSDFGDQPFHRREIEVSLPESDFAEALEHLQKRFPLVEIGSYPSHCGTSPRGKICLTGKDETLLDSAEAEVRTIILESSVGSTGME